MLRQLDLRRRAQVLDVLLRAEQLQPLFAGPLGTPSLHVWGERDAFAMSESPKLLSEFDAAGREVARWPGPHVVPTHGPAADAIVRFVLAHASPRG